jgi:predicted nucleic acid-binding protein
MDAYLLDTCFLSKLYDQRRPDYAAVRAAALDLDAASPQYLSVVVLAELRYGLEAAELAGQNLTHIRHTIEQAATRQVIEVSRHTAQAYGEVKAQLAAHWTDLSRKLPRWLEDWKDRVSSKSLQVDEGDLWLVAQAIERNYVLVTTDQGIADRFGPAVPDLRMQLVRGRSDPDS